MSCYFTCRDYSNTIFFCEKYIFLVDIRCKTKHIVAKLNTSLPNHTYRRIHKKKIQSSLELDEIRGCVSDGYKCNYYRERSGTKPIHITLRKFGKESKAVGYKSTKLYPFKN